MAARGLAIRADVATATELRRLAKKEPRRRTAQRMLAIANALDGMSRAEAARAAGIERQALRDARGALNGEGLAGLIDRPYGRRPERLSEAEQAVLVNHILRGPDPDNGEPCAWTLPDLCRFVEARFDKRMSPQSMSRVVRRPEPARVPLDRHRRERVEQAATALRHHDPALQQNAAHLVHQ